MAHKDFATDIRRWGDGEGVIEDTETRRGGDTESGLLEDTEMRK
ncbi:hypothetical protein [Okeania sp. SIO3B5]|nr:hypothetical protein [Okeania sp. SIO3B5]